MAAEELSVVDFFGREGRTDSSPDTKVGTKELGISRYRSFSVLPSVSRVDEVLEFKNILPDTAEEAERTLRHLLGRVSEDYEVVIPSFDGQIQPLCGYYKKDCKNKLGPLIKAGSLKMQEAVQQFKLKVLPITSKLEFYKESLNININTPKVLSLLRKKVANEH